MFFITTHNNYRNYSLVADVSHTLVKQRFSIQNCILIIIFPWEVSDKNPVFSMILLNIFVLIWSEFKIYRNPQFSDTFDLIHVSFYTFF